MRFALLSLIAVAALAVSAGSVDAQFRTRGGFASPMMMNFNPRFNTSPFMNRFNTSPFMNRFNTSPFMHRVPFAFSPFSTSPFALSRNFSQFGNSARLFPTSSFAMPFPRNTFAFPSSSAFPATSLVSTTGGFASPAVSSPFVLPGPSSNFHFWSNGGSLMSPWWW